MATSNRLVPAGDLKAWAARVFERASVPPEDALGAADVLVVLGTSRDRQSYRYTSPMKLFEYLATGRPIVASRTPAICEIVSEEEVLFYEPDDVEDLARVVLYAIAHSQELAPRQEAAERKARTFSWQGRAERVRRFIEQGIYA